MITCWLCRKKISSHLDARLPLSPWARRHAEACPACRQFLDSAAGLAAALTAGAENERRPASPFLHGKIMSAIRAEKKTEAQPAAGRAGWAFALATACVVLTAVVWLRRPPTPVRGVAETARVPATLALSVSLPTAARVDQWTKSLDAPLEDETQLVLSDARAAIDSLKNSFLPDDAEGTTHGRN